MDNISTYSLRLPTSLKNEVGRIAKRDKTSINQFIAMAVAEKVSAFETEKFFLNASNNADVEAFKELLNRSRGEDPRIGDELP